jgi:hypothetical protein
MGFQASEEMLILRNLEPDATRKHMETYFFTSQSLRSVSLNYYLTPASTPQIV